MALVEIALRIDGEWRIIRAGRPVDMIAFEDEFGIPGPDPESGRMWRQVSWLAHRIDAPREPFDVWVERVEDIAADPATVAKVTAEVEGVAVAETAEANGLPESGPFVTEAATGASE